MAFEPLGTLISKLGYLLSKKYTEAFMPKLYTYLHTPYPANLFKNKPLHFVSVIANSDHEARHKLNLYPLAFVSQKPLTMRSY